jgi:DNA/RNA endonuclease YhcR with UshA esterase domain
MKESHLMVICGIGLFSCIAAIYMITSDMEYIHVNIADINKDWAGKDVNITGKVFNTRRSNGSMFFDLDDGTGKINVVLWNSTLELLKAGGVNTSDIKNGRSLNIIGYVEMYKSSVEVIPYRDRVKILQK